MAASSSSSDMGEEMFDVEKGSISGESFSWAGLGFSVKVRKSNEPKVILHDTAGLVHAGEMLYVMGSSGAGKPSMMDALSGRVSASIGGVQGATWLGGETVSVLGGPAKAGLKYVEQKPTLYETLTTQETLQYAAEFYCENAEERIRRVNEAIHRLGLESARNTKCGGIFYRGLSGGQLRRVSVGVELVARPKVLLLDEPTSGLDAASALQVMEHLQQVARSGVAVVCSIHQPAQRIFALCDKVMLLASGRCAYFGTADDVMPYFARNGFSAAENTSTCEWLLDELSADFHEEGHVEKHLDAWENSKEKEQLLQEIRQTVPSQVRTAAELEEHSKQSTYKRSLFSQTALIAKRNLIEALRNPAVIYLRAAMYIGLALMIGVGWWRLPTTADRIQDRLSAIFFTSSFTIFMSIAVITVYLQEKQIIIREMANGSFAPFAYLAGHFVSEFLFIAGISMIISSIVYWMVNFNPEFSRFVAFTVAVFASLLVAESIMILIAALVPFLLVGIAVGAFLFGFFMVVQGFFVDLDTVPQILRWAQFISLHRYSFGALAINELSDTTFGAAPDSVPSFPNPVSGQDFLNQINVPISSKWGNIGVMFGMILVYRFLTYLWIARKWKVRT